jgi:ABC-type molybdate transport system permease subunit
VSIAITLIYYALCVYAIVFLGWNFVKTKDWQKAALQVVVILPFLLRVLRIK